MKKIYVGPAAVCSGNVVRETMGQKSTGVETGTSGLSNPASSVGFHL